MAAIAILVALPFSGARRGGAVMAWPLAALWASLLILSFWILSFEGDSTGIREFVAIGVAFLIVDAFASTMKPAISKKISLS